MSDPFTLTVALLALAGVIFSLAQRYRRGRVQLQPVRPVSRRRGSTVSFDLSQPGNWPRKQRRRRIG